MKHKPEEIKALFEKLATDLNVDRQILEQMLAEATTNAKVSGTEIVISEVVAKAIEIQQLRAESEKPNSIEEGQGRLGWSIMKKGWRPHPETKTYITSLLIFDGIEAKPVEDIGFAREYFIREKLGSLGINWDGEFLRFALRWIKAQHADPQAEEPIVETIRQTKVETRHFSDEEIAQNKAQLNHVTKKFSEQFHATPYLDNEVTDDWRPADWVVDRLKKSGISKRFIFDDELLRYFILLHKGGSMYENYNVLYERLVRQKFSKVLKQRIEIRDGIERCLEDIKEQQEIISD